MAPSLREIIHQAWSIPGIHPRMVRQMLIQKSAARPRLKKTETGGKNNARKYRQTSLVGDAAVFAMMDRKERVERGFLSIVR